MVDYVISYTIINNLLKRYSLVKAADLSVSKLLWNFPFQERTHKNTFILLLLKIGIGKNAVSKKERFARNAAYVGDLLSDGTRISNGILCPS